MSNPHKIKKVAIPKASPREANVRLVESALVSSVDAQDVCTHIVNKIRTIGHMGRMRKQWIGLGDDVSKDMTMTKRCLSALISAVIKPCFEYFIGCCTNGSVHG